MPANPAWLVTELDKHVRLGRKTADGFARMLGQMSAARMPEELDGSRTSAKFATCDDPRTIRGNMTTLEERVFSALESLAATGSAMLNNELLAERVGWCSRSSVLRVLRRLNGNERIRVEGTIRRGRHLRRIVILATSQCTDWGESRPGHPPFTNRRRGEPAPTIRPAKPRKLSSWPLKPQVTFDRVSSFSQAMRSPRVLPSTDPISSCQHPGWLDGERPAREPKFCGKPTIRKASYCREHAALCIVSKADNRRAAM